jgi:hypothetical protein
MAGSSSSVQVVDTDAKLRPVGVPEKSTIMSDLPQQKIHLLLSKRTIKANFYV